jgi:N4-gp56 family major capsid protein
MAITRFRPEIWSAALLVALRKSLVYAGPQIVNRDYEGEISQAGDTVRITSISRPTIGNYVPNSTTITPEELTDAQRTLVVDQAKYFAFKVDDVDARQAKGNVMIQAMSEAAYALADIVDQYVAGLYTQAAAANVVSAVTVDLTTPTSWDAEAAKAYNEILVPLAVKLDEANVPEDGRYVVLPPWLHGVMRRDPRFVEYDKANATEGLRKGQIAEAAGFTIYKSNNTPTPTANNSIVLAGRNTAISFAEQINKTEAYRPESSFSDAIKGLALYGAKVIRPESLAYATAIQS